MFTEELLRELIESINNANRFSWSNAIELFSLVASWITIIILIKDKLENKRPYLQIAFELVKGNLACIVLRNVGNVPLEIKKLELDKKFIMQLPEKEQQRLLKNHINKMRIFPGKQWVLSLGIMASEILNCYSTSVLDITYEYSKIGKNRKYRESTQIDFSQYSEMLVYISDTEELRSENKKIKTELKNILKELKNILKELKNIRNGMAECRNREDVE